jgi:hypothetical protein
MEQLLVGRHDLRADLIVTGGYGSHVRLHGPGSSLPIAS